jgi:hypothetical protein
MSLRQMHFEKTGREGSAERRAFEHDLVNDMSLTTGLPTEAFHVKKLSPIGFIADIATCTQTSVDSVNSHKLVGDFKVQAVDAKVYDSITADIQICTQGSANESNLLRVVGDLEDQSKDPKSLLYCGVVTQHVQSLTIVKPMVRPYFRQISILLQYSSVCLIRWWRTGGGAGGGSCACGVTHTHTHTHPPSDHRICSRPAAVVATAA